MEPWWIEIASRFLPLETIFQLLMAIAAGALIGWEREKRDKPAGLRTHMLVSLGAAAFMIGALEFTQAFEDENPAIRLDPMRVLAGIIGGVGFLGAGTIIQSRGSVRGITTAASIWVSAAIGTCCGMRLYELAVTSGIVALAVLWVIGFLEHSVFRTKGHRARQPAEEP
jgi:putative Mg2+ transporter-C (MgtC) family protein